MKKLFISMFVLFVLLLSSFVSGQINLEVLVVGGGGGGGVTSAGNSGGGGAGGLIHNTSYLLNIGTFPVVIGTGGATASSANGTPSIFDDITAAGGGGGGYFSAQPAKEGGSGGGGAQTAQEGAAGIVGQGNAGGASTSSGIGGGGGGGAGAVGGDSFGTNGEDGGDGGVGLQIAINGSLAYYAGGGGGSSHKSAIGGQSSGGLGGGGKGQYAESTAGTAGTVNTGGGGGGGGQNLAGGNGGSGIVIISYLTADATGIYNITGGTINTNATHTFHTFKSSADFIIAPVVEYLVSISLYSPENNSYLNTTTIDLYFNVSISNSNIGLNNISLYIDGEYIESNTTAIINNANSSFTGVSFPDGEHTWNIKLIDSYSNINNSKNYTLLIDTSQPLCVGLDNESVSINSTYTWDVGCSDDNFFSFNITCDNGFNYFQDNIEDSVWNFSNSTSIDDETLCFYQYCDGHTGKEIKIDVSGLKSSYYRIFDGSIRITSHNSLKKFKTKERFDRIEFEIETVTATDTMNFTITNNKPINIMNQLDYKGWIITGDYWIDFEEEMDDNHVSWYRVKRISSQEVRIDLKFDKTTKKFKFKSIGKLNCESGYQLFSVLDEGPLDDDEIREFETIPEALFWMFLTVLWIFFFLGSLMILNPISNKRIGLLFVAEVFIGVVVSIGWIKNYNVVIGGLILAVSLLTFTYHSMLE